MYRFNLFIILISIVLLDQAKKYQYIQDYEKYNQIWFSMASKDNIHNLTHLSKGQQKCYGRNCQYYVYEHFKQQNKSYQNIIDGPNITILFVSGMHGNQQVGPIALLQAYQHLINLRSFRLLFFPIANPSGYIRYQRDTFPTKIDPNRDFPIDNNNKCYYADSTRILDYLYRNWKIDLTIALHNGGNQIAWNWGSFGHIKNSKTLQDAIYRDIGSVLKSQGGYNNIMHEFTIGTMNEIVYPVVGSFEDWAYAGSWQKNFMDCSQIGFKYQPYPQNMTNGLVFLIQLSPHNVNQQHLGSSDGIFLKNSNLPSNGYISRAIRLLIKIVEISNPSLEIHLFKDKISLKLKGCNRGQLSLQLNSSSGPISFSQHPFNGSELKNFTIKNQENSQYNYTLLCDKQWIGKGKTLFSQPRSYKSQGILQIEQPPIIEKQIKPRNQIQQKEYYFLAFIVGFIVGVGSVVSVVLLYLKKNRIKKQIKKNQIFSAMELVQEIPSKNNQDNLLL